MIRNSFHSEKLVKELSKIAWILRKDVIDMIHRAGSGHPGGSLSAAEALKKEKIKARVLEIHTLKPIDKNLIIKATSETSSYASKQASLKIANSK